MKIFKFAGISLIVFLLSISKISAQTVFITETGKKYHSKNCSLAKKEGKAISLVEAKKQGYTPCTACGADKIVEKKEKKQKTEKPEKSSGT